MLTPLTYGLSYVKKKRFPLHMGSRLCLSFLAFLSCLTLGASPIYPKPVLIAKAQTLNPAPIPPEKPTAIVYEETLPQAQNTPQTTAQAASGGTSGRILRGNNCVACVKAMTGRGQNGNAGQWRASSSTPWIGAIMIFYAGEQGASGAGHVGVVTGIHGNQIELAHCNWQGQTTFYSTGKFW